MTKRDLVGKIADVTQLHQAFAFPADDDFEDSEVAQLNAASVREFFRDVVQRFLVRRERKGRNPKKPANEVVIPERAVVKFRAGKVLKERVESLIK